MATTVAELIERARQYADVRDDGDDSYISDATLTAWLNQENRRLVRRIGRLGYAWGETSVSFALSTPLSDVLAITGVYEASGTRLTPVARLVAGEYADTSRRLWQAAKSAVGVVTVSVGTSSTYVVKYVPVPARLVTGTPGVGEVGSVYYPAGWEDLLVLGAALRAKAKEGSDSESPLLRQLYEDEWDDIEVEAANADANTVVRNVDGASPPGFSSNYSSGDWYWL